MPTASMEPLGSMIAPSDADIDMLEISSANDMGSSQLTSAPTASIAATVLSTYPQPIAGHTEEHVAGVPRSMVASVESNGFLPPLVSDEVKVETGDSAIGIIERSLEVSKAAFDEAKKAKKKQVKALIEVREMKKKLAKAKKKHAEAAQFDDLEARLVSVQVDFNNCRASVETLMNMVTDEPPGIDLLKSKFLEWLPEAPACLWSHVQGWLHMAATQTLRTVRANRALYPYTKLEHIYEGWSSTIEEDGVDKYYA
ncbi:hypothetical protein GUJ93_ZPchr0008g13359 [Zizania palustris]|uniref:Uncharacterized protein n=1 Tax=Zizania palustris TaxID=103762 RepID=A0A8J5RYM9_ZIZPA|nr:hypothetical protein GUJ93_ZPchr0008g13359 [Zizania palustris]